MDEANAIIGKSLRHCLNNILLGLAPNFDASDYIEIRAFRRPTLDTFLTYVSVEAKQAAIKDCGADLSDPINSSLSFNGPLWRKEISNFNPLASSPLLDNSITIVNNSNSNNSADTTRSCAIAIAEQPQPNQQRVNELLRQHSVDNSKGIVPMHAANSTVLADADASTVLAVEGKLLLLAHEATSIAQSRNHTRSLSRSPEVFPNVAQLWRQNEPSAGTDAGSAGLLQNAYKDQTCFKVASAISQEAHRRQQKTQQKPEAKSRIKKKPRTQQNEINSKQQLLELQHAAFRKLELPSMSSTINSLREGADIVTADHGIFAVSNSARAAFPNHTNFMLALSDQKRFLERKQHAQGNTDASDELFASICNHIQDCLNRIITGNDPQISFPMGYCKVMKGDPLAQRQLFSQVASQIRAENLSCATTDLMNALQNKQVWQEVIHGHYRAIKSIPLSGNINHLPTVVKTAPALILPPGALHAVPRQSPPGEPCPLRTEKILKFAPHYAAQTGIVARQHVLTDQRSENKHTDVPLLHYFETWKEDRSKVIIPRPKDILLGRGKRAFNHIGNVQLRRLFSITTHADYGTPYSRMEKTNQIRCILSSIIHHGGRFLKKELRKNRGGAKDDNWYLASYIHSREKIAHGLRDAAYAFEKEVANGSVHPDMKHKCRRLDDDPQNGMEVATLCDVTGSKKAPRKRTAAAPRKRITTLLTEIGGVTYLAGSQEEPYPTPQQCSYAELPVQQDTDTRGILGAAGFELSKQMIRKSQAERATSLTPLYQVVGCATKEQDKSSRASSDVKFSSYELQAIQSLLPTLLRPTKTTNTEKVPQSRPTSSSITAQHHRDATNLVDLDNDEANDMTADAIGVKAPINASIPAHNVVADCCDGHLATKTEIDVGEESMSYQTAELSDDSCTSEETGGDEESEGVSATLDNAKELEQSSFEFCETHFLPLIDSFVNAVMSINTVDVQDHLREIKARLAVMSAPFIETYGIFKLLQMAKSFDLGLYRSALRVARAQHRRSKLLVPEGFRPTMKTRPSPCGTDITYQHVTQD